MSLYKPRSKPHNPFEPVMLPGVGTLIDKPDAGDVGLQLLTQPEATRAVWANPAKNMGVQARRT